MGRTVRAVSLWTLGFAVFHSLLASRLVKTRVRERYGSAVFDGWYRLCFNAVALVWFAGLLRRFSALPDRELYHVRPPWSLPMRSVQVLVAALLLDANHRIGIGRMTGVQGWWEWIQGRKPIAQNPAQGPQLQDDLSFRTGGAFQLSRHPNNLGPLLLWVAHPRMTVRFLTFIIVSAAYLLLGSVHEEQRLAAVYGETYDRYREGKSFYLPLPPRAWFKHRR